ncbi:Uncharacterised protein [Yersinia aldovae]|uniref:Uncharacterized protein n=1 Tax=Yersinia aldovae TaxID=29483 RepID=A0ABM9SNK3_YERAL|nr:Uncharacterised protein [Yersinia aldovae]
MDAERGPLEHGCESARSVSEMMNRGNPRSGQAIRAKRGIPQGCAPAPFGGWFIGGQVSREVLTTELISNL